MHRRAGENRHLVVAAACAGLLVGLLAIAQIDDGFQPHRAWLDLEHPERFAIDLGAISPSPIAYFQWQGRTPLVLDLGLLRPGDHLTLKLRSDSVPVTVNVEVDGRLAAALAVTTSWQQFEAPVGAGGATVTLHQTGFAPAPVHVSRISVSNIRGALEGPAPIWFTDHHAWTGPVPLAAAGLMALLAVLLVLAWGRHRGTWGGLWRVTPALVAFTGTFLWWQAGGHRPHVSSAAFLAFLLLPTVVAGLAAGARRLRPFPGAVVRRAAAAASGPGTWLTAPLLGEPAATSPPSSRRPLALHLGITAVGLVIVATVTVGDFRGPVVGNGDLNQWTHQASYLARNLTFGLLPHLDLVNDQLFYPYGGDNVYQPWALEMNLATLMGIRVAPTWGWLQLYFLLTLAITAVGGYLLLAPEVGPRRASAVALAVAFCNFYALGRFPGQLGVACVHWTTLNLLADAVLVRRVVQRRPLGARFVALRVLLLVLALGQDLSYVAGIALTSFLVVSVYLAALVAVRSGFRPRRIREWLLRQHAELTGSLRRHPVQVGAILAAAAAASWLWLPLTLDIVHASALYDFHGVPTGSWWANPLRLMAPVLPGVQGWLERSLGDSPAGLFAASPGLLFVLPAAAAVLAAWRRRWMELAPFIALLVLLLTFQPTRFTLLRVLPWCAFARVSGRFSVAYPTILAILALTLPPSLLRRPFTRVAGILLVLLAAAEITTAYASCSRSEALGLTDPAFRRFAATIRHTPGEAVLDWPFCLVGGNGVGGDSTGSFYGRLSGISVLQSFHGKKIVGKYFGRLHPDQLEPYLSAGWDRMFMPNDLNSHRARRQRRDFTPQQWDFLHDFFTANDFCGIILYTDLLPPETVAGFHHRFGNPVARYEGLQWGPMEFIPKPAALRTLVNRERGRTLRLADFAVAWKPGLRVSPRDATVADFLRRGWVDDHTEGPVAVIRFALARIEPLALTMKVRSFGQQRVIASLNGAPLGQVVLRGAPQVIATRLPAAQLAHDNVLRLDLPDAHSPASAGLGPNRRELALGLEWMRLGPHPAPVLTLGQTLPADAPFADEHLRSGWSTPAHGARTTVGDDAEILFAVREVRQLILVMSASTFGEQRVAVDLNGVRLTTLKGLAEAPHEVEVTLPSRLLQVDNRIVLRLPDARSPKSLGIGRDPRRLGLTLHWLKLVASPAAESMRGPTTPVTTAHPHRRSAHGSRNAASSSSGSSPL